MAKIYSLQQERDWRNASSEQKYWAAAEVQQEGDVLDLNPWEEVRLMEDWEIIPPEPEPIRVDPIWAILGGICGWCI